MALLKKNPKDIPKDAVLLSSDEVVIYSLKLVQKWDKPSEVWALKYGSSILGVACATAGFYFNDFYRWKFKLKNYGKISSFLPIMCIPAVTAILASQEFVTKNIILGNKCPTCIEMRAAAIQAGLGCVMPFILAPTNAISLAHKYATYNIPYFRKEPLEVFKLIQRMSLPLKNTTFGIFLGQAMLGSAIAYVQAKNFIFMTTHLEEIEKNLEDNLIFE